LVASALNRKRPRTTPAPFGVDPSTVQRIARRLAYVDRSLAVRAARVVAPGLSEALFLLAAFGHASPVNMSPHTAPEVLRIFLSGGITILNRLRPVGAGEIALGEARGCGGCNGKSKRECSQLHNDHDGPSLKSVRQASRALPAISRGTATSKLNSIVH
jgi:hypothetical protein